MEERKDNKGLASLEDILEYASNDNQNETNEPSEVVSIDSTEENDSKSIFENPVDFENIQNIETTDFTNTDESNSELVTNESNNTEETIEPIQDLFVNEEASTVTEENSNISEVQPLTAEDDINQEIKSQEINKGYFGFKQRVVLLSILFVVPFVISIILAMKSLYINNAEYINYTETSNLDYKVYLKENSFYDEPFLGKDMLYVASLIDHIDIDFLYNFNISEKLDLDLNYSVNGVLRITDIDGKKTYLTKKYDLLPSKSINMKDMQDQTITEKIIIDYDKYNQLANSFKATYGVDTSSVLSIYLDVEKNSNDGKIQDDSNSNNMLIEIPLSQRSVSISMDYKNINNNSSLSKKEGISVGNLLMLVIAFGVFGLSLVSLVKLLKMLGVLNENKTLHDKYINKIMKQYDRLIVEHFTCPELKKYNIIKIKEFNELLDMRDNLKVPILYYNVTRHEKSYFYIQNYKDLYLLIIKNVDLENEKKR